MDVCSRNDSQVFGVAIRDIRRVTQTLMHLVTILVPYFSW